MEHRRVHPQHLAHGAHDSSSFDIFPSPFYSFPVPDTLGGGSKATQPPHPLPQYAQQHYAPDSGSPLETQRSPQRPYCPQGRPQQGHSHIGNPAPPPALQQPQPRPAAAYPLPLFPQDHEGYSPSVQTHYLPLSRAVPHQHSHIPNEPPFLNPFTDSACQQPRGDITRLSDFTYACHPQPRYSLPTTLPSAATHTPPEHSPSTSVQGPPSTFHQQHDNSTNADHGSQRSRSWGGAGSLDPATGVFSRAADHPRIRTAQACEKCRARKAKCSGEHPTCQRCQARGLPCAYASERRMRGPNKPKLPPPPHPDGSQPAAAEAQKTRKRASTMPSAQRRGSLVWGQQKNRHNQQRQQQGIVSASAASPASPASSTGSGSFGYPPLSESEASPMTPHSSLDSRRPSGAGLPVSPRLLFTATMPPGVLSHVGGSNGYEDDGDLAAEGLVPGEYGRDIPPDVRMSFEGTKTLF